ncbi:MAG: HAMP domain-containing sensor histidine kinase [Calditrichia bacterium]
MQSDKDIQESAVSIPVSAEELQRENRLLLEELETAYSRMEQIIENSNLEKAIAYRELQKKFDSLENLYVELSQKENMLIHMEKLSSIGQFITELIHELSSPLTAITLQAQMAQMGELPAKTGQQFNVIEQHADRMNNLLSRFRAMAYKGKEAFKSIDVNQNLRETLETIEIIKPKKIRIHSRLCDIPLWILGDSYQLGQIYLNLSKNAFDAMKDGGETLTVTSKKISSSHAARSSGIGRVYTLKNEEWEMLLNKFEEFALIEFCDEGSGIAPDLIKNLFQPFFTTKERGKGTGLGLSISGDIAQRHNGNLAVKSTPGAGTTFQLILPLCQNDPA